MYIRKQTKIKPTNEPVKRITSTKMHFINNDRKSEK